MSRELNYPLPRRGPLGGVPLKRSRGGGVSGYSRVLVGVSMGDYEDNGGLWMVRPGLRVAADGNRGGGILRANSPPPSITIHNHPSAFEIVFG